MLQSPKAPVCLTALTACVLCCSVLIRCCVWQWLKPCLSQVETKATTDIGSAAPSVKSYWLYMCLFIPQCRYSWMLEEYFAWDLTVFISEYSEQIGFLKTPFYFWTVSSFPLGKQISITSYPALLASCIGKICPPHLEFTLPVLGIWWDF